MTKRGAGAEFANPDPTPEWPIAALGCGKTRPMSRPILLPAALLCALFVPLPASAAPPALTLDDLFPDKPLTGRAARAIAWSHDDRYVAYLWNPYDPDLRSPGGSDIWIWDRNNGSTARLTSLDMFAAFDRDIPKVREAVAKEREEAERRRKLSEAERKALAEDDRRKAAQSGGAKPAYAGIGEFRWAHQSHEILFTYRGDLYRIPVGNTAKPRRLTRTRDSESNVDWSRDDKAFVFRRGDGVYRRGFDAVEEEQISPDLPAGMRLGAWRLSPDGNQMLVIASRRAGAPARTVSYLTYRERFAQAKTTERDVADDPDAGESVVYCHDIAADGEQPPRGDGKPWEIARKKAGEAGDVAMAEEPFSPDGKSFTLATWKRDSKDLRVLVGDIPGRKIKTVLTDTMDGEHRSPSIADPFFSPDGSRICVLLEKSGFRHAWLIDPKSEGATQLTRGDFEVYPLRFTPDGKQLLVRSSKEDPSRMEPFRVDVATGVLSGAVGSAGQWSGIEWSHDGARVAGVRAHWSGLAEMEIHDREGRARTITASHAEGAWKTIGRVVPTKFSFSNRHGQTVHGSLMAPPGVKPGEKRPLLIYVYGGPLGEDHQVKQGAIDRFGTYCAETFGYYYAVIDPRGNSGYGAVFGKANYGQPGVAQVEDLVDGVRYLGGAHGIDPAKVGIHGWSFGGFQTQMCLYTAPDTFHLGIAGAGPTEWQNYNTWYVGGVIGAGKKAEELDQFSLTKKVSGLKAPLLLLHGMEDTNVLAQDTIKVYRELLKAGKGPLVELVLDPTGGHGLGGDIDTRRRYEIYAGFLDRRWGRSTAAPAK